MFLSLNKLCYLFNTTNIQLRSKFYTKLESTFNKGQYVKIVHAIGLSKRPTVSMFNMKWSNSDPLNLLSRFESSLTSSRKEYRPNSLALEHINSGNPTTSETINSVLLNQKVSISQKELDELLYLPKVKFDLPVTDQTYPALLGLI